MSKRVASKKAKTLSKAKSVRKPTSVKKAEPKALVPEPALPVAHIEEILAEENKRVPIGFVVGTTIVLVAIVAIIAGLWILSGASDTEEPVQATTATGSTGQPIIIEGADTTQVLPNQQVAPLQDTSPAQQGGDSISNTSISGQTDASSDVTSNASSNALTQELQSYLNMSKSLNGSAPVTSQAGGLLQGSPLGSNTTNVIYR